MRKYREIAKAIVEEALHIFVASQALREWVVWCDLNKLCFSDYLILALHFEIHILDRVAPDTLDVRVCREVDLWFAVAELRERLVQRVRLYGN